MISGLSSWLSSMVAFPIVRHSVSIRIWNKVGAGIVTRGQWLQVVDGNTGRSPLAPSLMRVGRGELQTHYLSNPATAARKSAISSRLSRPSVPAAAPRPHGKIVQCPKSARELVIRNHSRTCDAGTWEQDSIPHTFSVAEVLQTIRQRRFLRGAIIPNASYRVAAIWLNNIAGSSHRAAQPKCELFMAIR
jgi:hypothetical protein